MSRFTKQITSYWQPVSYTHLDVYKRQILGMIPLLGDAMFGSMAATIMGGLFFSTIATLLFLPILCLLYTSRCV